MNNVIIENLDKLHISRADFIANGFSGQKYDDVLRGKSSFKIDDLTKISEVFQISLDELIFGERKNSSFDIQPDIQELINNFKALDSENKARLLERAETLKELSKPKVIAKTAKRVIKPKPEPIIVPAAVPPTDEPEESEDEEPEYIYLDFPSLPASAGTGVYLHDDCTEPLRVPADELTCAANYALRVSGNSMEPRFYDGDIVLVKTQPCVDPGEIGIFIYECEAYIKLFGSNRLISLNPAYDDIRITDPDSFYCKGKVIGILDPVKYL